MVFYIVVVNILVSESRHFDPFDDFRYTFDNGIKHNSGTYGKENPSYLGLLNFEEEGEKENKKRNPNVGLIYHLFKI